MDGSILHHYSNSHVAFTSIKCTYTKCDPIPNYYTSQFLMEGIGVVGSEHDCEDLTNVYPAAPPHYGRGTFQGIYLRDVGHEESDIVAHICLSLASQSSASIKARRPAHRQRGGAEISKSRRRTRNRLERGHIPRRVFGETWYQERYASLTL